MDLNENILSKKTEYEGLFCTINSAIVKLANKSRSYRETVEFAEVGCVAAINEKSEIILINEFQFAQGKTMLELPNVITPLTKENEILEETKQKLLEKTGIKAATWQSLGKVYFCPRYLKKTIHLFLATDLTEVENFKTTTNKVYEIKKMPLRLFEEKIANGTILDAKTICCAHKLCCSLENKKDPDCDA